MKLLFNKDPEKFSREFKEILGFVDADFRFAKIAPDLRNATREIKKLLGADTYSEIVATYNSNFDPTSTEGQILLIAQTAIANQTYRFFAPSNDLQHGVNGRKMLTSEESKTPFEHMLVASNDELERRTNRALDDLIEMLDEHSATWKASEEYKKTHRLFVRTTSEFDQFFTIESRYLLQKLSPGMALAEKRQILSRIGQSRFDSLKDKRKNNAPLSPEEEALLLLIQEATVYSSLAWGVVRLQLTMFPDGIFQAVRSEPHTVKARTPFAGNQIDQLAQRFEADAQRTYLEIEKAVAPPPDPSAFECPDEDEFGYSIHDKFAT